MKRNELAGQRFGRLVVVDSVGSDKRGQLLWRCKCDCGNEVVVYAYNLKNKKSPTVSCGCKKREYTIQRNETHRLSRTRLYRIYNGIIERCTNDRAPAYPNYGGRGICVCDEWLNDFLSFYDWAMANGYQDDLTIDRIDVNGDYEPSNCRWATRKEQMNNTTRNHKIFVFGEELTLAEAARKYNVGYEQLKQRLQRGWDAEDAITEPSRAKRKRACN